MHAFKIQPQIHLYTSHQWTMGSDIATENHLDIYGNDELKNAETSLRIRIAHSGVFRQPVALVQLCESGCTGPVATRPGPEETDPDPKNQTLTCT